MRMEMTGGIIGGYRVIQGKLEMSYIVLHGQLEKGRVFSK
jgi:hypothetical protein